MEQWQRKTLLDLRDIAVKHDFAWHFKQVFFTLEGVKKGTYGGCTRPITDFSLRKYLYKFRSLGLYVSHRHGVYITKDESLYKKWNSPFFRFKHSLANEFLGYPKCCVDAQDKDSSLKFMGIYTAVKDVLERGKNIDYLRKFCFKFLYIDHKPHSLYCRESEQQESRYSGIVNRNLWLFEPIIPLLKKHKIRIFVEQLKFLLLLDKAYSKSELIHLENRLAKEPLLAKEHGINPLDCHELIYDKDKAKRIIHEGIKLLNSLQH
jgi:hypothetical protein